MDWVKRNIVDEPRLGELVGVYESLGFEVQVKEFTPDDCPAKCKECLAAAPDHCRVIYTRPKMSTEVV